MNSGNQLIAYWRLYTTTITLVIADQLSKCWILKNLQKDSDWITVVEDFFYIVHVGNEGAAWGIFSGYGKLLTLFGFIALAAIFSFRRSLQLKKAAMQWTFGMICGGIIGNTADRILHGHVIDFLDFHLPLTIPVLLPGGHYPTFNIADCGIVIGVFIYLFIGRIQEEAPAEKNG